jgi:hypothetical protein
MAHLESAREKSLRMRGQARREKVYSRPAISSVPVRARSRRSLKQGFRCILDANVKSHT